MALWYAGGGGSIGGWEREASGVSLAVGSSCEVVIDIFYIYWSGVFDNRITMKIEVTFDKKAKSKFREECINRLRDFVEQMKQSSYYKQNQNQ